MSLLSWERGLKLFSGVPPSKSIPLSLLSWERGLKSGRKAPGGKEHNVAPLVGAWIEIGVLYKLYALISSLLSWERGLKSRSFCLTASLSLSLLSWERGLKSLSPHMEASRHLVAPLVGAWIEIAECSATLRT